MYVVKELTLSFPNLNTLTNMARKTADLIYHGIINLIG